MDTDFIGFPKIPRLSRECVVTEKIDGTNALLQITPCDAMCGAPQGLVVETETGRFDLRCGSRSRWITPQDDNYGFSRWVYDNSDELVKLGPGRHHGEWWGQGIGRKYGLTEKRWSLFNTSKWSDDEVRPKCCHVVPVIGLGMLDAPPMLGTDKSFSNYYIHYLKTYGSAAAPGFMNPEGIIIYHVAGNLCFKKTIHKDEEWKGKRA